MTQLVKDQAAKVKGNLIGGVVGAGAAFWAAKKFGKVENKWALAGIAVVGLLLGANVQAKIAAKKSMPKPADVKK